jgi:hypothetical protein
VAKVAADVAKAAAIALKVKVAAKVAKIVNPVAKAPTPIEAIPIAAKVATVAIVDVAADAGAIVAAVKAALAATHNRVKPCQGLPASTHFEGVRHSDGRFFVFRDSRLPKQPSQASLREAHEGQICRWSHPIRFHSISPPLTRTRQNLASQIDRGSDLLRSLFLTSHFVLLTSYLQ